MYYLFVKLMVYFVKVKEKIDVIFKKKLYDNGYLMWYVME